MFQNLLEKIFNWSNWSYWSKDHIVWWNNKKKKSPSLWRKWREVLRLITRTFRLNKGIFWKYRLKICDCLKRGHISTFLFRFDVGMMLEMGYIGATALFLLPFLAHLGFNATSQLMAPNFWPARISLEVGQNHTDPYCRNSFLFTWFIFWGEGREREMERWKMWDIDARGKHWSVAFLYVPQPGTQPIT